MSRPARLPSCAGKLTSPACLPGCIVEPYVLGRVAGQLLDVPHQVDLVADVLVAVALQQQQGARRPDVLVELSASKI